MSLWKEQEWQWERFGVMVDVKNADLWKRIDRAREFHQVACRVWRFGSLQESFESNQQIGQANILSALEPIVRPLAPAIRPPQKRRKQQRTISWTDLAAAVANQLIPAQQEQQAFGCA